jgi:D-threo-aldose 1-dehydrogenase
VSERAATPRTQVESLLLTRSLPNGKPISALGFGCSSLWAKRRFDPEDANAILVAAEASGINHFDTGPSYGEGESRLGRFLIGRDRSRYVISTKIGTHLAPNGSISRSFDLDRISASFENSLRRLGVSKVDILYLHGPTLRDLSDPLLRFLEEQKSSGYTDFIGINSFDVAVVEKSIHLPIDAVMLQYSIADLRFEQLIKRLYERNKFVIGATILGQSIFTPRTFWPTNAKALWYFLRAFKNGPTFPVKGFFLARRLRALGLNPHEAAVRFAVGHPMITSCLFGSSLSRHVLLNSAAAGMAMDQVTRAKLGASR